DPGSGRPAAALPRERAAGVRRAAAGDVRAPRGRAGRGGVLPSAREEAVDEPEPAGHAGPRGLLGAGGGDLPRRGSRPVARPRAAAGEAGAGREGLRSVRFGRERRHSSLQKAGTTSVAGPWRVSSKKRLPREGSRLSSTVRAPAHLACWTKPAAG